MPYADRMELAYAAADLVVARSGANTVCELTAVGLPAVYVPLPVGNGEQRLNAADVVAAGGGLLVDDADFTPEWIDAHLLGLASRRASGSLEMGRRARELGEPRADELLADMVDDAASRGARHDRARRASSTPSRRPASTSRRRCPTRPGWAGSTSSPSAGPACPGVARIMLARGIAVTGSDAKDVPVLRALESRGRRRSGWASTRATRSAPTPSS